MMHMKLNMTREKNPLSWLIVCVVVVIMSGSLAALDSECKFPHNDKKDPDLSALAPLLGKRLPPIADLDNSYKYYIGICTNAISPPRTNEIGAGILQIIEKTNKRVVIGKFTKAELKIGTDWAMLEYRDGQAYGHHCNGTPRVATIMITCDPDVHSIEDVNPVLIEEVSDKSDECYYLFELSHSSICNYRNKPAITFSLSIGSIVVIVFVSLVGVYLVAGLLYNRFVLGSKGIEQIPNFHFWMDFGNLQADGCNLVCRTRSGSETRLYKGVADDQLGDDDDRDEHLLPM